MNKTVLLSLLVIVSWVVLIQYSVIPEEVVFGESILHSSIAIIVGLAILRLVILWVQTFAHALQQSGFTKISIVFLHLFMPPFATLLYWIAFHPNGVLKIDLEY